jgi:hypothetical protein
MVLELTAPDTPQMNGVVERRIVIPAEFSSDDDRGRSHPNTESYFGMKQ